MSAFKQISAILACTEDDPSYLWFECPGCGHLHGIHVGQGEGVRWTWDGNIEAPTFNPSVSVKWKEFEIEKHCHSFIRAGNFEFLGDCTHALANTITPIAEWGSGD